MIHVWYFEPPPLNPQSQVYSLHGNSTTNDNQNNQASSSKQATALLTHQDRLQVPQELESQVRFADSGAFHHITYNLSNLQNK